MNIFAKTVLAVSILALPILTKAQIAEPFDLVGRGRYVVQTTGCNDCHTPRYGERNGAVPENEWLIGVGVGYKGPWGTTYPANLRHLLSNKTESQWVAYAKRMRSMPPMPWYNVNAMSEADLRGIYQFIRSLGDSNQQIPHELPPGVTPSTPYINFEVVMPKTMLAPGVVKL